MNNERSRFRTSRYLFLSLRHKINRCILTEIIVRRWNYRITENGYRDALKRHDWCITNRLRDGSNKSSNKLVSTESTYCRRIYRMRLTNIKIYRVRDRLRLYLLTKHNATPFDTKPSRSIFVTLIIEEHESSGNNFTFTARYKLMFNMIVRNM